MNTISPEEFKTEMERISKRYDPEYGHEVADDLMCELLEQLGYSEGIRVFYKMAKWYG